MKTKKKSGKTLRKSGKNQGIWWDKKVETLSLIGQFNLKRYTLHQPLGMSRLQALISNDKFYRKIFNKKLIILWGCMGWYETCVAASAQGPISNQFVLTLGSSRMARRCILLSFIPECQTCFITEWVHRNKSCATSRRSEGVTSTSFHRTFRTSRFFTSLFTGRAVFDSLCSGTCFERHPYKLYGKE